MIYMDITGGINGLLQMIFIAYDFGNIIAAKTDYTLHIPAS